jgi:hypothetical protein
MFIAFAAGAYGITQLPLQYQPVQGLAGIWGMATLLPLAKRLVALPPAEGQGEVIVRQGFQVIQGGRREPSPANVSKIESCRAYLKIVDYRRNPEKYEQVAKTLRELERAA